MRLEGQHARPLLFPDEILRLPQTCAIVLKTGCAPIWCTKLGVDTTPHASPVRQAVHTARQHVQHRPWAYATVGGCLLLALMLSPIVRLLSAKGAPPAPQAAVSSGVPPATPTLPLDLKCALEISKSPACRERDRQQSMHETAGVSQRVAPTTGAWVQMKWERDRRGQQVALETPRRYPTHEACAGELTTLYEPLVTQAQQSPPAQTTVTRTPGFP